MIPLETNEDIKNCFELILNYSCNARCLFCSQGSFSRSLSADYRQILRDIVRGKKSGYARLGLTGGEPLIRGDILKIVAFARAAGFSFIRIQTNGIRLADERFAASLVRAGLTYVKFSIHSRLGEEHDRLLGVPGAWEKAMSGMEIMKKLKVRIGINTLLNRENYKDLPEFVRFYLKQGVADFVVIYPLYTGNMLKNLKAMAVPLGHASAQVIKTFKLVEGLGLGQTLLLLNIPPCFVPGYENQVIGTDHFNTVVTDPEGQRWDLDLNRDQGKVKGEVCGRCALNAGCLGVDSGYVQAWGWRGVRPIKKVIPRPGSAKNRMLLDGVEILTDNEKCLLEILRLESPLSTRQVLGMARSIPLCRDCTDSNAVLGAAERLVDAGIVARQFRGGQYLWSIAGRPVNQEAMR